MKKCTMCVDRIYNENLPAESRVPACVSTCPTGARSFGDLGDPESEVSRHAARNGAVDLMPEQGCRPVNKNLPARRPRPANQAKSGVKLTPVAEDRAGALLRWADKILSR